MYEGEGVLTKDNRLLGKFTLTGIPPAQRCVPKIIESIEVEANGILKVVAEDRANGNKNSITITNGKGGLSKEEIDRMVRDANKYKSKDKMEIEKTKKGRGWPTTLLLLVLPICAALVCASFFSEPCLSGDSD